MTRAVTFYLFSKLSIKHQSYPKPKKFNGFEQKKYMQCHSLSNDNTPHTLWEINTHLLEVTHPIHPHVLGKLVGIKSVLGPRELRDRYKCSLSGPQLMSMTVQKRLWNTNAGPGNWGLGRLRNELCLVLGMIRDWEITGDRLVTVH